MSFPFIKIVEERRGIEMAFTAQDVKTLRERTGVGMMDCKRLWPKPTAIWIKRLIFCGKRAWPPLQKIRPHRCGGHGLCDGG